MNIFIKIHKLITKAIVEIAERRKSLKEISCMTKHFVKIVHSLAIPAAGSSLWDLLIEQVCRGVQETQTHSDGSLFAHNTFCSLIVTISFYPAIMSLLRTVMRMVPWSSNPTLYQTRHCNKISFHISSVFYKSLWFDSESSEGIIHFSGVTLMCLC